MPFTPSPLQQIMIATYNQAQNFGLRITRDTIISTAFTWGLNHFFWRNNSSNAPYYELNTIGTVDSAFDELIANGYFPNLS